MIKHIIIFLFSTLLICQDSYLGDLNIDSNVDVIDIVQLVDIILGTTPTDQQLLNGDVNEDFVLNIQDVVIIINIILDQLCPTYQNQCDPSTLDCCSSHDIEFEVNTFGDYSNDIYDSWIFSDDHILAVGELFVVDEGNYSAVLWDGETWNIIRMYYNNRDLLLTNLRGVWALICPHRLGHLQSYTFPSFC